MSTWLITGCSTGLGRALAEAVLARGDNAAVTARDASRVEDLAAAHPETALALALDVTDAAQVRAATEQTLQRFGAIDVLVNNAGYGYRAAVEEAPDEDVAQLFATNVFGAVAMIKAVLPGMRARKWGRITNISSGAARGAGSIGPHYNASKAGIEGLTRGYAARLVKEGITVNAVAPSLIETDMMKGQPQLISRIPLGRFGQPEEVAKAVMMLIDNPYMTGQTIAMSGGMAFN